MDRDSEKFLNTIVAVVVLGVVGLIMQYKDQILYYSRIFIIVVLAGVVVAGIVWIVKKYLNAKSEDSLDYQKIRKEIGELYQKKQEKINEQHEPSTEPAKEKWPYRKNKCLFSESELVFYKILQQVVHGKLAIFPKVRLADIVHIPKAYAHNQSLWYRIQAKHVDFLLCRPENATPVLAIELDGSSHETEKAQKNDDLKNEIFEDVGLPLLRVQRSSCYDLEELKNKINGLLSKN